MLYQFSIVDGLPAAAGNYAAPEGYTVLYEVIRVTDGIFLFLDDHLNRLQRSARLAGITFSLSVGNIRKQLEQLLQINRVKNGNIKMEFHCRTGQIEHWAIYFIQHRYPPEESYRTGIRTTLFPAERANPNAKIIQPSFTEQIDRILVEKKVYEAILTHPGGYVTEGARSNFFMVQNGSVYTAPEADVLPGITRKYVLKICRELSVPLIEKRVNAEQLPEMTAAFISGTSPKVLPVAQIDGLRFDVDSMTVRRIMKRYDELAGLR
jgi:branched-chain amino acid aminotransferase